VVKRFGDNAVCNGISLDVQQGEMVCLIGASGAGKSTLLRCINLLDPIDDGEIFLDGDDISQPGLDPQAIRGRIGMVFQSFNLFPHMTALENAMLAPRRVHNLPRKTLGLQVETLFERFKTLRIECIIIQINFQAGNSSVLRLYGLWRCVPK